MKSLSASVLLRCFWRSYFVGAAYNPRGLQNIGFLFAIDPGLCALYGPGKALRNARMRYAKHYNSHPFFTPMLLGAFLRMESTMEAGLLSPHVFLNLKDTTANALSGIGDSFFSGTLLNTWALCSGILLCMGMPVLAGAITLALFVMVQAFKLATFALGYKRGMALLFFMKRLDLINWGERLKCINAALLSVFLCVAMPGANGLVWTGVVAYLLVAGWLVGRLHICRAIVAVALLLAVISLHNMGLFNSIPFIFSFL